MLQEVKEYLRVDGSEEDLFLTSLINAAKTYILNATGTTVNEEDQLHLLAVSLLVSHWYENREVVGKADKLAYSLDSILFQLQFSGSDTV